MLLIRGPVNEDVFTAPASTVAEMKTKDCDIQELTEQIHRLLLQVRWIEWMDRNQGHIGLIIEKGLAILSHDKP